MKWYKFTLRTSNIQKMAFSLRGSWGQGGRGDWVGNGRAELNFLLRLEKGEVETIGECRIRET
jgi:hypothetical protein